MSNDYPAEGAGARPRRVGNKVKIGACVIADRRRREKLDFSAHRRAEIDKIIKRRHGGVLPETDDVDIYFRVMAKTVAASFPDPDDRQSWMVDWLSKKAPWLEDVEYTADKYLPAPGCPVKHLKARPAGEALRLRYAERKASGIRTISAFDKTPAEVRELRRQDDRDRKRRARAANGSKPRAESLSETRPWEAEGIGRSTYYRRLKSQVETNSAHHDPSAETTDETNSAHHPNAGETNSSRVVFSYKDSLCDRGEIRPDEFVSPSIVPTIPEIEIGATRQRGPSRAPAARSRQLDLFEVEQS